MQDSQKNPTHPKIVSEDDSVMIITKPSGWITNEAITTKNQPVVQTWIKKNFNFPIFSEPKMRHGIVHRLDKETSGILIVAKTETAFTNLQKQFKDREVNKVYLALSHGKVLEDKGIIEAPVGRLPWRRDRFGVLPSGRKAKTNYKVVKRYKSGKKEKNPLLSDYTLLEVYPKTGRTHQIRIHLKYIGHPIVSDDFYAGRKTARSDRKWCQRLFLHAKSISFIHPKTKKPTTFKSKLPSDLKEALQKLSVVSN